MQINTTTFIFAILNLVLWVVLCGAMIYLFVLLVKALRKYLNSKPIREQQAETSKTLGEVLKAHRTDCKMTQEFVAEQVGVSRQAVSKWESGTTSPSTANLMMLAKLFDVAPEDLLRETQK